MRNIFVKKIIEHSKKNRNLYFLSADLGFNSFEILKDELKERFITVGVAENNMAGIAAGLALQNKDVYMYSIVPFIIFRSFEQIRNNICHNNLNVKIIGGGGGFSYGDQGISHNTSEDLSITRVLPNLKVFTPSTKSEVEYVFDYCFKNNGPAYFRLGKVPEFNFEIKNNVKIGDGITIKKGKDILIFSCGNIIEEVNFATNSLKEEKINCELISYPCIKPINEKFILKKINKINKIVIVEENSVIGGFGSAIMDILSKNSIAKKLLHIGLSDKPHGKIGNQNYLRKINNLDKISIFKNILKFANEK
jgi:transketolase